MAPEPARTPARRASDGPPLVDKPVGDPWVNCSRTVDYKILGSAAARKRHFGDKIFGRPRRRIVQYVPDLKRNYIAI